RAQTSQPAPWPRALRTTILPGPGAARQPRRGPSEATLSAYFVTSERPAKRARALVLQDRLDLVQMLLAVVPARQVERRRALGLDLREHRVAQRPHLPVGLLGDAERELRREARWQREAERLGRLVRRVGVFGLVDRGLT